MTSRYPLASSSWDDAERLALERVIDSGQFTMAGEVRAFERTLAERLGVRHCVMVNSGSSANLLMAAALRYGSARLQPGDEILVPSVGWATTYFPFAQLGLRLRFVDVDAATLNVDAGALERAITPRTRAVCLVHVLGNPCAMDAIARVLERARARGQEILLLEDACESLGASYGGRACGAHGLMGSFSFFFSHHISTMEGGCVVTDDDELHEALIALRAHGWTRDLPTGAALAAGAPVDPFAASFHFVLPGFNVRPLELSGAVGLEQLRKLDDLVARRRHNADVACRLLAPIGDRVALQRELGDSSWFGFALLLQVDGPPRAEVVAALRRAGIECRPVIAGNFARQPALAHVDHTIAGDLVNADAVHDRGLYVGNAGRDLTAELEHLAATLASVGTQRVAA